MDKVRHAAKLFMHWTGPLIQYQEGILYIENLNPQVQTKWTMTRGEMIKLGLACIKAAFTHSAGA